MAAFFACGLGFKGQSRTGARPPRSLLLGVVVWDQEGAHGRRPPFLFQRLPYICYLKTKMVKKNYAALLSHGLYQKILVLQVLLGF